MAVKKSDLYASLWQSCDELRGGMDASQYKDYVLFMLFIKYVTDKYADSDEYSPPVSIPIGASFKDMLELRGSPDIGDRINTQVIAPLVQSNTRLAQSDFPDFNDHNKLGDGKEMVDRLTNLINIFANPNLDFSRNRADHDDILGDAYEYLMQHFASESGKSKGQFYTPAEVSRVIALTIGITPENTRASTTAYDPTCGSGSLLLKVAAQAEKHITLEGQEKDVTTAGMARMNLILHDFPTATILSGNTLTSPKFKDGEQLRTYDYVVANPPFSDKTWTAGLTPTTDPYQRFTWGIPPAKQGDYAYLQHIIRSMKSTAKAACILPHGVLFRSKAEAKIREQLIRSRYLKGIIGLPPNLFYGTGIPACILLLDKENAAGRSGVFMIDASKGFKKDGAKNRLREQDIHRIVDTYRRLANIAGFARMVPYDEIVDPKNDFNLNLPRYVANDEPEDLHDIESHLYGGIPERDINALEQHWRELPSLREALFESTRRPGYIALKLAPDDVKPKILGHAEYKMFQSQVGEFFAEWCRDSRPLLIEFSEGSNPKTLINTISEALLAKFWSVPLLNAYDVYQRLMDYWSEIMQDDTYLVAAEGWVKGAQPHEIFRVKGKNNKLQWSEPHDYLIGRRRFKSDLLPAPILVARFFAQEQSEIVKLNGQLDTLQQMLDALLEEHGDEDGLLSEVAEGEGDKKKITQNTVKLRLKEIGNDPMFADEQMALRECVNILQELTSVKKTRNMLQNVLYKKIDAKYSDLNENEIKSIVVEDKWITHLYSSIQSEIDHVSQTLTNRVNELVYRYEIPLPKLIERVESLSTRVNHHLTKIGVIQN